MPGFLDAAAQNQQGDTPPVNPRPWSGPQPRRRRGGAGAGTVRPPTRQGRFASLRDRLTPALDPRVPAGPGQGELRAGASPAPPPSARRHHVADGAVAWLRGGELLGGGGARQRPRPPAALAVEHARPGGWWSRVGIGPPLGLGPREFYDVHIAKGNGHHAALRATTGGTRAARRAVAPVCTRASATTRPSTSPTATAPSGRRRRGEPPRRPPRPPVRKAEPTLTRTTTHRHHQHANAQHPRPVVPSH